MRQELLVVAFDLKEDVKPQESTNDESSQIEADQVLNCGDKRGVV